jgi:acyl-CoA dehydrogenase
MASKPLPLLDFDALRPPSPFMDARHDRWRQKVRCFVEAEIAPYLDAWDAAGTFPEELYAQAANREMLGMGFPRDLGGSGEDIDLYHRIIYAEEFYRLGSGVVFAELATHFIALPPVIALGAPELLEQVARPVLAGQQRIVFAVTEPSGGSDVAAFTTHAERQDESYIVSGGKTLISGALRADYLLTAVRTGGQGGGGLSLLLIDADAPGISRGPVEGLGWFSASNGWLAFDQVRVPAIRLIGPEGRGFAGLASQFNVERFSGIAAALALARCATAEAIAWARQRHAFGKRIADHQAIRHKLVEMVQRIRGCYANLDVLVWRFGEGEIAVADLALLKIQATTTLEYCAREAMQILAGRAYLGAGRLERIYREARTFAIGGGTEEVLRDLAARQLGI